jgi:hypothetical protein
MAHKQDPAAGKVRASTRYWAATKDKDGRNCLLSRSRKTFPGVMKWKGKQSDSGPTHLLRGLFAAARPVASNSV